MTNHHTVKANNQIDIEPGASAQPHPDVVAQILGEDTPQHKTLKFQIARHISNILSPASISLPVIILIALYHASNSLAALGFAGLTILFLSLGPLAYILIGVRLGKLSDVDVSRRSERMGPFLFGIGSACLGILALLMLHGPKDLLTLLLLSVISGIIMLGITLWWKISIHASSLGSAATILTALYGLSMLPIFLLLILVSWSRVVLRRHTLGQVIGGSIMSICLTTLLLLWRGI